mmetsp:Transcript_19570/g.48738  ORF Transcript_19570/g.48738 Transcript_19570/m.48738 type:complete len:91 (-) Transcript_19570:4-276(-)
MEIKPPLNAMAPPRPIHPAPTMLFVKLKTASGMEEPYSEASPASLFCVSEGISVSELLVPIGTVDGGSSMVKVENEEIFLQIQIANYLKI